MGGENEKRTTVSGGEEGGSGWIEREEGKNERGGGRLLEKDETT